MGALAEAYGFYGADGGAGEVLMVGDTEEAFVFHILSDPTARSAIWAAQRVPDSHVAVVANMFSIREVDLTDTHTFLGSANLHSVALAYDLWDGRGRLDFTAAYSGGEYANKYYTGRRVWDGLRRFKPSLVLPAEYGDLKRDKPYPFSVEVDQKLSVHDWFGAHRSHYEGTPYDMTVGLAAGPFGSPDRYGQPGVGYEDPGTGAWQRSVGVYRTSLTWVVQATAGVPDATAGIAWLGPADSSKTVFTPVMVSAGAPLPFTVGNQAKIDRRSAYWAHRYVQNLAQLKYNAMIVDIQAASHLWEARGSALVAQIRAACSHARALREDAGSKDGKDQCPCEGETGCCRCAIQHVLDSHATNVLAATWDLADALMVKYADGASPPN
eukprot:7375970-Prymnesium_polylepis.2